MATAGLLRLVQPDYNAAGENTDVLQCQAYTFHLNWPLFKDANYDLSVIKRPDGIRDEAWSVSQALFNDKKKVDWIKKLEAGGLRLRDCTEMELRDFLQTQFTNNKCIATKSVKNICTLVRSVFKDIGRRHSVANAVPMTVFGINLGNTGNPMTQATTAYLKEIVAAKKAQAQAGDTTSNEKLGAPVSVVLAYTTMLYYTHIMIDRYQRFCNGTLNDPNRIVNLAMLNLLYALGIHEGTRQIDVVDRMIHANQWFPLHEKVYWLTLVLLKPATLAFLLEGNKIRAFNIGLFKGKQKQTTLNRLKAMIPCAYNSIDMVTIYVICMKVALHLQPDLLTTGNVFKPSPNNYSDVRSSYHKKLGFDMFTFYSFRYSGAEEDKKGNINPDWTRQRMGHSTISDMKDQYAKNKEKRVAIGNESTKLGMDIYEDTTNNAHITLEFNVHDNTGVTFDTKWLDETFAGTTENIMQDFIECSTLATAFIDKEEWAQAAITEHLAILYDAIGSSWVSEFPLGLHIKLAPDLVTPTITKIHSEAITNLQQVFKEVPVPSRIPELWSCPQTMYGNWRRLIDDTTPIVVKPPVKKTPVPPPPPKPQPFQAPSPPVCDEKDDIDTASDTSSVRSWEYGFRVSAIEKKDSIVIYCQHPDACAMRVAKLGTSYVWIARIKDIKLDKKTEKTATITAQFYYNREKDITKPLKLNKKVEKMTIHETSIINVFTDETLVRLTKENIKEIIDFMRTYIHKE
jgi:hypothetical protein